MNRLSGIARLALPLALSGSLLAQAAPPEPMPTWVLGNDGFVRTGAYGYRGSEMVFCPPHVEPERFSAVKTDQCKAEYGFNTEHFPLVNAQGFLDGYFGEGQAQLVGIAPAPNLQAVIYYRRLPAAQP
ncbi:hypothetical protein D3C81_1992260 [compost metagenome]